jgi:hypothetical protein
MKLNRQIFYAALVLGILSGCSTLYDKKNFIKGPATGEFSGKKWTFMYGYTDAESKKPDGVAHLIVLVSAKPDFPCPRDSDKLADQREVIIGVDGKAGEMVIGGRSGQYETDEDTFTYTRSKRQGNAGFFDPKAPVKNQYTFAKSGKIRVTKITADTIEGYVLAKNNPNQFINGRFSAKICKWGQLH